MVKRELRLRDLFPYLHHSIKVCHVSPPPSHSNIASQLIGPMTTIRLAFYYRIFPILRFRRICVWLAHVSLVYMVVIDFTVIFQWYAYLYISPPALTLNDSVTQSTTPGTVSAQTSKATASTSTDSSSPAAPSTPY